MYVQPALRVCALLTAVVAASLVGVSTAPAFDVPRDAPRLAPVLKASEEPSAEPSLTTAAPPGIANARGAAARPALERFFATHGDGWEVRWDDRGDRPNVVQGAGIELLRRHPQGAQALDVAEVEKSTRRFIDRFPELFRISRGDLRLDPTSTAIGADQWFLQFEQTHRGVPVEGARVFFRFGHGRLVQFGSELVGEVRIDATPAVTKSEAAGLAFEQSGVVADQADMQDAGTLLIVPRLRSGEMPGERYEGAPGEGYDHRLVWQITFRLPDDQATYRARVDAKTGELVELIDVNLYATVSGGIYPQTNTDPEEIRPFPQCIVNNNGTKQTDAAGLYSYDGGTATTTLNGRYIRMSDNCGAISLSNSTDGNLDFGTSGGTNCTTPGLGGAGNTHSTRTAFYHLTQINRRAASYLPGNAWLNGTLQANVNINQACNAFWNGSTVNFYRSGSSGSTQCSNTGEISDVFLHEWGHGLDENTGGAANENGSGEAVGDTFAMIYQRDGCIGENFIPGENCHNCEACTGVRDVSDFDISGPAVIARPSNIANNAGPNCDQFVCPYLAQGIFPYQGPMGYEGHCESYIASSAMWDLAQMLIAAHGTEAGWAQLEKIWYTSLAPTKSAYQVVSGGKCNPSATVNGCAASNWYTALLPADDNDGNLANGTPNACRIWDAFNAHGIACGTRPVCSGAPPTPTPTRTPTPANTPIPTQTAAPTNTPTSIPTSTPVPSTPTPTSLPTSTPTVGATPIPTSTGTPAPTATPPLSPTPTASPTPAGATAHVGDLDGSRSSSLLTWRAQVSVTAHDAVHGAVAGATVSGTWSAGNPRNVSCVTAASGRCTVTSGALGSLLQSAVTLNVTGITAPGRTYLPAANHDPDGDSNGTTIQVRR
jgi:trimeric autotransporter adhesin